MKTHKKNTKLELENCKETLAIKSSPSLMAGIKKGMKDIKKAKSYTLEEIFRKIG